MCQKPYFLRDYDVISPDDVILRILKCYQCVPGHISYGIGDQICIKSETNRAKIAQIWNFCLTNGRKCPVFTSLWRHISHYDIILKIWKWHHCTPGHISYGIGDQICITSETNRFKIAQIGNLFSNRAENGHNWRHYNFISPDDFILRNATTVFLNTFPMG